MKGGMRPHGFTIIEIMIFLAVSGFIFLSVITLMSGKQDRTEFQTSVSQLDSQLQTLMSSISSGYYNYPIGGFGCQPSLTGPQFFGTTSGQGSHYGCALIGTVLQFDPSIPGITNQNQAYETYPVAGNQFVQPPSSEPVDAITLAEEQPKVLPSSAWSTVTMQYGLNLSSSTGMYYVDSQVNGGRQMPIGGFGLFIRPSSTAAVGTTGLPTSGSSSIELVPIPGSAPGQNEPAFTPLVNGLTDYTGSNKITTSAASGAYTVSNPDGGISICLNSGTDQESALFVIGGSNSPTRISLRHFSQKNCIA